MIKRAIYYLLQSLLTWNEPKMDGCVYNIKLTSIMLICCFCLLETGSKNGTSHNNLTNDSVISFTRGRTGTAWFEGSSWNISYPKSEHLMVIGMGELLIDTHSG